MTDMILTLVIAVVSSNALTAFVQHRLTRKTKACADYKLILETLAAVTYSILSSEVEKILTKGFASPEERRTLKIMHDAYIANGWNGDMDARMAKVYNLPTVNIAGGKK